MCVIRCLDTSREQKYQGAYDFGLALAYGIGLQLNGSINTLAWTQVSTILLAILVTVFVSEWVSAKVRGAII